METITRIRTQSTPLSTERLTASRLLKTWRKRHIASLRGLNAVKIIRALRDKKL